MTSGQKIAASLLVTVLAFAAFTLLSFAGLFPLFETKFYQPGVRDKIEQRISGIASIQEEYSQTLADRFYKFSTDADVLSLNDREPRSQAYEKFNLLKNESVPLTGVRIIAQNGRSLIFSSFPADILKQDKGKVSYANYDKLSEIPFAELDCADLASSDSGEKFKVLCDDKRILYAFPFVASDGALSGSIVFYCSPSDLGRLLIARNAVSLNEKSSFLTVKASRAGGYLFGLPENDSRLPDDAESQIEGQVREIWEAAAGLPTGTFDFKTISFTERQESQAENGEKIQAGAAKKVAFVIFTRTGKNGGMISWLFPETIFSITREVKILLLGLLFVTLYLIVFLLFNIRRDDMTVIRARLRQIKGAIEKEYSARKAQGEKNFGAELTARKKDFKAELEKSLGKRIKKHESEFNAVFEETWRDIFLDLGQTPATGHLNGIQTSGINIEELRAMLEEILGSGKLKIQANVAPAQPVYSQVATPAPKEEEPEALEEVESLEEVPEAESVEEVESLEEVPEAESVEEVESLEEVPEAESVEEVESLEEVPEAESVEEVESLEEVPEAESVEEVESLEEVPEAESVEEVESLEEVPEAESAEEVESLEEVPEAESAEEVESVEEVPEAESVEEAESLEEVPEAESVEEVESVGEVPEAESVEEVESLEEVPEAESAEEVDSLDEVPEAESAEEVAEAESVEVAESIEEMQKADSQEKVAPEIKDFADIPADAIAPSEFIDIEELTPEGYSVEIPEFSEFELETPDRSQKIEPDDSFVADFTTKNPDFSFLDEEEDLTPDIEENPDFDEEGQYSVEPIAPVETEPESDDVAEDVFGERTFQMPPLTSLKNIVEKEDENNSMASLSVEPENFEIPAKEEPPVAENIKAPTEEIVESSPVDEKVEELEELDPAGDLEELEPVESGLDEHFMFTSFGANTNDITILSEGTSDSLENASEAENLKTEETKMPALEPAIVEHADGTFTVSKDDGYANVKIDADFKSLVESVLGR